MGVLSDLWDIGVIVPFHPATADPTDKGRKTIDVFSAHVQKDPKHLSRYTSPEHPVNFKLFFGPTLAKMEALRHLTEHEMGRFRVTVQSRIRTGKEAVWIIGEIMKDGSLLPNTITNEQGAVDRYGRGTPIDITPMLDDPLYTDPNISTEMARTLMVLRRMEH